MRISAICFLGVCSVLASGMLSACHMGNPNVPEDEPMLDIGDGGFLSEEPCGPPCFLNITPGITTKEQTFEILQTRVDLQNCLLDDVTDSSPVRWIECGNVSIGFDVSGYVEHIRIMPTKPISMDQVLSKYGNPDRVFVMIWEAGYSFSEDKAVVHMSLLYDSILTRIDLPAQEGEFYNIEPDTQITQIYYIGDNWESLSTDCKPWVGFGKYSGEIAEMYP